jgi:hypothetical protein
MVGLVVFAVALWAQTSAMVGVFYDDGIYVAIAKALAEGSGLVPQPSGLLPGSWFATLAGPPCRHWLGISRSRSA